MCYGVGLNSTGDKLPHDTSTAAMRIWNNKGGVGKTFVTFVIAAEYAIKHPDQLIVVIDMCPQANISEILLGGNDQGSLELGKLLAMTPRQTVGGYFDQRINQPHVKTGTEINYLMHAATINTNLPNNVFMVAGDPSLELQAQAINQVAAQTLPQLSWANVHSWLIDLTAGIVAQHPSSVFSLIAIQVFQRTRS
jgi:chromosome partitioning protein